MRMRWVIARKSDDSLKARLVIQGFTDPQLGAKPTASPTQEWTTTVSDGGRVLGNEGLQGRCKNGLVTRVGGRSRATLRTNRRTGTSTGIGIAKIGVRFDRRSESLVGTCGNRHE